MRPNTGFTPPASLPVRNWWTLKLFGFMILFDFDDEEEEEEEEEEEGGG